MGENAKRGTTMTLHRPRLGDWTKLYRLYRLAFPASERKPFAMIIKMYRRGKTDIWCVEREGRFAGLAITINGPDTILLDYFAVEPDCRGQGVGAEVLARLREIYGGKRFFLEIESTLEPSPELELRKRRKNFYLRCGLQPMGVQVYLFGVKMELLGAGCVLSYEQYHNFYRDNYNTWAADHIAPVEE